MKLLRGILFVLAQVGAVLAVVFQPSLSGAPLPPPSLPDALNAPGFIWTSGQGTQPAWTGTTEVSHDGIASATVGPLPIGAGNAHLNARVTGPGFLYFWSRLDVDLDSDDFLLRIDNSIVARVLNRSRDWREDAVFVPVGTHTVTWTYYRDGFARVGRGQAWVDEVELVPGNGTPQVYRVPPSLAVWRGQGVILEPGFAGSPFLSYQWLTNGAAVPNARGGTLFLLADWPAAAPVEAVLSVSNSLGVARGSSTRISTMEALPLGTALELPGVNWTTGAGNSARWFGQDDTWVIGGSAAAVGPIATGGFATLGTLLPGPGVLTFRWRIAAGKDDSLEFVFNGSSDFNNRLRGVQDWNERTIFVPAGTHSPAWRFNRDVNSRATDGMAWVDGLRFTPGETKPLFAVAPTDYATPIGTQGAGFRIVAIGTQPIAIQWYSNGIPIPGATFTQYIPRDPLYPVRTSVYTVQASNRLGITVSQPVQVHVAPPIPIAEALEWDGLTWETSAPYAWYGATNTTSTTSPLNDHVFSPTPDDGSHPTLSTVISGPARVGFTWRSGYSRLEVRVNDETQFGPWLDPAGVIFGERSLLFLGPGPNFVDWIHHPSTNGFGTVTLDQLTVDPGLFAPQVGRIGAVRESAFIKPPVDQIVDAGNKAAIEVEAVGSPPLHYRWFRDGSPVAAPDAPRLVLEPATESHSGTYTVVISNSVASVTSPQARLTVVPIADVIAALDAPNLPWNRGGTAFWLAQSTNTHDGIDALVNGLMTDRNGGTSDLNTRVEGPGRLSFWWRNNADSFDDFDLLLDDDPVTSVDNDNVWHEAILDLRGGTHALTWRFSQDGAAGARPGRAFLDQIRFQPGTFAPAMTRTNHAAAHVLDEGESLLLSIEAIGTPPLTYELLFEGRVIRTQTFASFLLQNVAPFNAGTYAIRVTNASGQVTGAPARVQVIAALPLAEAADAPELNWISGGTTRWIGQDSVAHDGEDAASSARLRSNGLASQLTSFVQGPGNLSFWWRLVGEEPVDTFDLLIDGVLQPSRLIERQDWSTQALRITNGFHTVAWVVRSGVRFGAPFDPIQGWLDEVEFTPDIPRILAPLTALSAGQLRITVAGPTGSRYRIETSPNLTTWTAATTATASSTRTLHAFPQQPTERTRYFRLIPIP